MDLVMRPITPTELKVIRGNVERDISEAFDGKPFRSKRIAVASQANAIMHDVLSQPPIGWNVGTTRAEYYAACSKFIEDQYKDQNPPGFMGTLIFGAIISGVISWLVRRWLDDLFPKE